MLSFSLFIRQGKKPPEWLITQNKVVHKDVAFGLKSVGKMLTQVERKQLPQWEARGCHAECFCDPHSGCSLHQTKQLFFHPWKQDKKLDGKKSHTAPHSKKIQS